MSTVSGCMLLKRTGFENINSVLRMLVTISSTGVLAFIPVTIPFTLHIVAVYNWLYTVDNAYNMRRNRIDAKVSSSWSVGTWSILTTDLQ